MIFSLSENHKNNFTFTSDADLDVFCFFNVDHSVFVPENLFWNSVYASLKRKKNVLILEAALSTYPSWNSTLRWDVGEHYLWLAPRSLSYIQQSFPAQPTDLATLKAQLSSLK